MKNKIVYRRPLGLNKSCDRKDLIRVVKDNNNQVLIDLDNHVLGRGAYIFKDIGLLALVKKKDLLAKALKCEVKSSIYEELEVLINKK